MNWKFTLRLNRHRTSRSRIRCSKTYCSYFISGFGDQKFYCSKVHGGWKAKVKCCTHIAVLAHASWFLLCCQLSPPRDHELMLSGLYCSVFSLLLLRIQCAWHCVAQCQLNPPIREYESKYWQATHTQRPFRNTTFTRGDVSECVNVMRNTTPITE